jgi:hypothetical protein
MSNLQGESWYLRTSVSIWRTSLVLWLPVKRSAPRSHDKFPTIPTFVEYSVSMQFSLGAIIVSTQTTVPRGTLEKLYRSTLRSALPAFIPLETKLLTCSSRSCRCAILDHITFFCLCFRKMKFVHYQSLSSDCNPFRFVARQMQFGLRLVGLLPLNRQRSHTKMDLNASRLQNLWQRKCCTHVPEPSRIAKHELLADASCGYQTPGKRPPSSVFR